jgi:hypothetical protein
VMPTPIITVEPYLRTKAVVSMYTSRFRDATR